MYVGKHRGVVFVRVVLFWFLFPKRRIYRSTRHRMPAAVLSLLLSAITIYHCYYCYYNLHLCGKPFKATLVLSLYLVVIEKWLHDCHKSSAFMSHKGQSIETAAITITSSMYSATCRQKVQVQKREGLYCFSKSGLLLYTACSSTNMKEKNGWNDCLICKCLRLY